MKKIVGPSVIVQSRAKRGLFDGVHIRYGNQVSHSERRTRRTFKPNIQSKTYFSALLQQSITTEVTTSAMRTIDKCGGLDGYILQLRPKELQGQVFAQSLKERMVLAKTLLQQAASEQQQHDNLSQAMTADR